MATTKFPEVSGMTVVISTALLYVANAIVLIAGQMLFPKNIVLGTHALSYFWAVFLSMSALTLLTTFVLPFVSRYENMRQKMFTPAEWMGLYLGLNFAGIWAITRFSEQFGLGVTSWMVVLILAIVMDVVQGTTMMVYGQQMKR